MPENYKTSNYDYFDYDSGKYSYNSNGIAEIIKNPLKIIPLSGALTKNLTPDEGDDNRWRWYREMQKAGMLDSEDYDIDDTFGFDEYAEKGFGNQWLQDNIINATRNLNAQLGSVNRQLDLQSVLSGFDDSGVTDRARDMTIHQGRKQMLGSLLGFEGQNENVKMTAQNILTGIDDYNKRLFDDIQFYNQKLNQQKTQIADWFYRTKSNLEKQKQAEKEARTWGTLLTIGKSIVPFL